MIQFLLKLFGVKIESAQEVSSVSLQLRNANWLGWIVFLALLLAVFGWWVYRWLGGHRELELRRRKLLTALRIALFALLLFILLRPVISFTVENRLRRTLVALIDRSASMDIEDLRRDEADVKRAQTVTGKKAADVQHIPRTELVKSAIENDPLALADKLKKKYDIEFVTFAHNVTTVTEAQAFAAPSPDDNARQSTAIGDAVRDVLNHKRGQPMAGIFLVTDGANNSGSEPLDAANAAAQDRMPLYIYGVGITSPRDVIVQSVFTQEVAFLKDEVPVTVRVRAQGLSGQTGRLVLKLGGEEVASKDVDFSIEGEQAVPLTFTPPKAGEVELTASIQPREDETVKDNNSASQRLRVIDSKIKVLVVEDAPRWEFRYLQSVLLRDRRIDAKFLLLQADPAISAGEGSPFVAKFPEKKEDLFKYDLVVIGDVNAKAFTPGQMDDLSEFVSKFGGAITFIAGRKANPSSFVGTPFAKLLPIELETSSVVQLTGGKHSTTLALTLAGRTSPMLKLTPNEQENAEIWRKFPPIQWINRAARAKPGAQVLLEDTDPAKANRFGKMPAMALQQYGVGQVLYIGTDDTWRWRQETNVAYYPLLWGGIVQRMALAHLLGGSKRTQLSADKQHYNTGDRVTVFARLYDQTFEPVKQPSVNGFYTVQGDAGQAETPKQGVQLRALPDQPGMYRGDFVAVAPGTYKFSVESDPETTLNFAVEKARFELGETAMNEPLLKEMARLSGGLFFREEELATLPEKLALKDERISRVVDAELWASPLYFLLVAGLVTTEWVLRKRYELK